MILYFIKWFFKINDILLLNDIIHKCTSFEIDFISHQLQMGFFKKKSATQCEKRRQCKKMKGLLQKITRGSWWIRLKIQGGGRGGNFKKSDILNLGKWWDNIFLERPNWPLLFYSKMCRPRAFDALLLSIVNDITWIPILHKGNEYLIFITALDTILSGWF